METNHTQLKAKCLKCNVHFVVCTWHPDKHTKKTLFCPECGQHDGAFMTWSEKVKKPVFSVVPGNATPTADMKASRQFEMPVGCLLNDPSGSDKH